jgi:isopentenyl diphosphate isomerase/L-lactate dehydrogenase-like FMN-dependent dehydrogenase
MPRRLPGPALAMLESGSEAETTVQANVAAFTGMGLLPRVGTGVRSPDLCTSVLGCELTVPVATAPMGVLATMHPAGELAVARGAAAVGAAVSVSTLASYAVEQVAELCGNTWFQLYFIGSRDMTEDLIGRVQQAGCKALIVTVDAYHKRIPDRKVLPIPNGADLSSLLRYLPSAAMRPRWLAGYLRGRGLTPSAPNVRSHVGRPPLPAFQAIRALFDTAPPTWRDLAWVRSQWDGPLVIKGITTPDDARRAMDIGADAVSV